MKHRFAATSLAISGLAFISAGWASPTVQPPAAAAHDPLPDAEGVVAAYLRARSWVNGFDPPPFDDPAARLRIANATGVCVILRNAGRVVGTGVAAITAGKEPDIMLRRAVGRALGDVLGDPAVAALPEHRRADVGRALTLELELAGPLQPLLGRSFHQIAQQIEPGLEGVAMRRGEVRAMLFPSQLRSMAGDAAGNIQPRLPGLAADLGLTPAELATLQRRHGVTIHRFRTTHLAQESPSGLPFETFRGDRIVDIEEVNAAGIASFADGIANHLIGKMWKHEPDGEGTDDDRALRLGLMGDYDPVADAYRPIAAPPLDQALAGLALMRYAHSPGVDREVARLAAKAASSIFAQLHHVEEGEPDPLNDPAACAAVVLVIAKYPDLVQSEPAIERLGREAMNVVYGSFDPEDGFAREGRPLAPHTQAILAAAIAQRLTIPDASLKPVDLAYARSAIDAAWSSAPVHQHVTLMPWIGWAELRYAEASKQPIANVDELKQVRLALEIARAGVEHEWPADLRGGFPLAAGTGAVGSGEARPTAQTTRPAAFFATMLRVPELTPAQDRAVVEERHLETMRFLIQLSVRDSLAWSVRNPAAAVGGLRSSVWDSRMPTAAHSLGLLTAVETLESMSRAEQ